jgi:hypothetical protein
MDKDSFRAWIAILLGILTIALLWSQRYRYVQWKSGTARIHQVTGSADLLSGNGWIPMKDESKEQARRSSPEEEKKKEASEKRMHLRFENARKTLRIDSLQTVIDRLKGSSATTSAYGE